MIDINQVTIHEFRYISEQDAVVGRRVFNHNGRDGFVARVYSPEESLAHWPSIQQDENAVFLEHHGMTPERPLLAKIVVWGEEYREFSIGQGTTVLAGDHRRSHDLRRRIGLHLLDTTNGHQSIHGQPANHHAVDSWFLFRRHRHCNRRGALMNENKVKKYTEVGYVFLKTCHLCRFSIFVSQKDFGLCSLHAYEHTMFGTRSLTIYRSGNCNLFSLQEDHRLGDYVDLLVPPLTTEES